MLTTWFHHYLTKIRYASYANHCMVYVKLLVSGLLSCLPSWENMGFSGHMLTILYSLIV